MGESPRHEFRGLFNILGKLLWYRSKTADKFKPNATPGMFLGWRIDNGSFYRGVLEVLDYNDMLARKATVVEVNDREVCLRDAVVFPLADAAEVALANFSSELRLEPIEDVVIPFIDDTPGARAKDCRVYITYSRMLKIGETPCCKGCEEDTYRQTNECVDRFEEAFGDKRQNPARRMLAFEDIGDVEVESVKYTTATPSSRGFDILDKPPDDEEPVNRFEISCPAMTAEVSSGKGRDSVECGDVLYEFCCDKDWNLGTVGQDVGVRVIRFCKESIDLSIDAISGVRQSAWA